MENERPLRQNESLKSKREVKNSCPALFMKKMDNELRSLELLGVEWRFFSILNGHHKEFNSYFFKALYNNKNNVTSWQKIHWQVNRIEFFVTSKSAASLTHSAQLFMV